VDGYFWRGVSICGDIWQWWDIPRFLSFAVFAMISGGASVMYEKLWLCCLKQNTNLSGSIFSRRVVCSEVVNRLALGPH
jgi:hypothetical protein